MSVKVWPIGVAMAWVRVPVLLLAAMSTDWAPSLPGHGTPFVGQPLSQRTTLADPESVQPGTKVLGSV